MITLQQLYKAIESQCDLEPSGAENCYSIIGPLDLKELTKDINYLNRHPWAGIIK